MTPVGDTARRFADESERIVARGDLMFLKSHTFTLRSSDPETTLSSLVKTAQVTVLQEHMERHFRNKVPRI